MSPRTRKGLRWFRWVALMAAVGLGAKAATGILFGANAVNTIASALAGFFAGTLILGGLAFALGWLLGHEHTDK